MQKTIIVQKTKAAVLNIKVLKPSGAEVVSFFVEKAFTKNKYVIKLLFHFIL